MANMPSATQPTSKIPVFILDGGLGTTLQSLDPKPDLSKYLWSSTPLILDTAALSDVHGQFVDAGADIIETATYQISFPGVTFMDYRNGVEVMTYAKAKEVMRSAVTLAREAADRNRGGKQVAGGPTGSGGSRGKSVALSLGPYGATMSPSTEYTAKYDYRQDSLETLTTWHRERLGAFAEDPKCWASVDYVAFETFGRCDEIRAVRQVMTELFASGVQKKKWWISCVFPEAAGEGHLPSGETVDDAVEAMLEVVVKHDGRELERPWGIGINCTKISKVRGLLNGYESVVKTVLGNGDEWPALLLYPDGTKAGEHYDTTLKEWVADGDTVVAEGEKVWHEELSEIVEESRNKASWKAIVAGGCCRTEPGEIGVLGKCLH